MDSTIHDSIGVVLANRLALIKSIQASFVLLQMETDLPRRFRRGDMQRELCKRVGIHFTGLNKRLVNEAMEGLGFIQIAIDGVRLYRQGKRGREHGYIRREY